MKRYFGSLSFYRQALMIGVPVMLQSLIQSLVSLVDNFMVAGLGDEAPDGNSLGAHHPHPGRRICCTEGVEKPSIA